MRKTLAWIGLLMCLFAESVIPVFAAGMETRDEIVYAAGSRLNVRTEPGMDGTIVGVLELGDALKRIGYSEDWSKVIYDGQERYVASRYLTAAKQEQQGKQTVALNPSWKYAEFAKITSGSAVLYEASSEIRRSITICVNAGHGTKGGASVKTQCHPDGTSKVTGGTTGAGAVSAAAVSGGMTFADGMPEAKVTLQMAQIFKEKLLKAGYNVLMIRDGDDVQLDNIARTVIANNQADCHIALHWDSTEKDKGAFYMSVPTAASYRSMEPVASNWQKHHALGDSLISGLKNAGVKIFSDGTMAMDLTQTSYSTIPSVDIELGDKASDHSAANLARLADGLVEGVEAFFEVISGV